KAAAELRDVRVRIDHVSFDRLHARLVVSTVVERHPKTLELRGSTDLRPSDPIRHFLSMILGSGGREAEGMEASSGAFAPSARDLRASGSARQATGVVRSTGRPKFVRNQWILLAFTGTGRGLERASRHTESLPCSHDRLGLCAIAVEGRS